jgi:hypothetical protein
VYLVFFVVGTSAALRFALLFHDSPRGPHYDFLLEAGESLKTWALPQTPEPGLEMPCEALADHRPLYLDYEGPLSGGRGTVARWDHGTYAVEHWSDEEIIIVLAGTRLAGRVELRRQAGQPSNWRFQWKTAQHPEW